MFKKLLKNNWAVTIGGTVLAALILRGIDKLFINDFFLGLDQRCFQLHR